jgi:hypothetical protein
MLDGERIVVPACALLDLTDNPPDVSAGFYRAPTPVVRLHVHGM